MANLKETIDKYVKNLEVLGCKKAEAKELLAEALNSCIVEQEILAQIVYLQDKKELEGGK